MYKFLFNNIVFKCKDCVITNRQYICTDVIMLDFKDNIIFLQSKEVSLPVNSTAYLGKD